MVKTKTQQLEEIIEELISLQYGNVLPVIERYLSLRDEKNIGEEKESMNPSSDIKQKPVIPTDAFPGKTGKAPF
jgi:hypothetical protein